jgi:hypothetical protein
MSKFDVLDLCLSLVKEIGEGYTISVTLFVNGSIVSGNLINHATYLKGIASILETPDGENEPTDIAKLMSKTFRELAEKPTSDTANRRKAVIKERMT